MGVEIGDGGRGGVSETEQSSPNETLAFGTADNLHFGILGHVLLQGRLEVICTAANERVKHGPTTANGTRVNCWHASLTHIGEIVDQNDLFEQMSWRSIHDRVDRPQ
jgi:hypothetical protein